MPDPKPRKQSPAKAHVAAKRPRDEHGHFLKLSTSEKQQVKSNKVIHLEENKTADDATLVDVKVTNPLRRITSILEQIKRRQATVVDFKFTIPLVALPVFMLVAFSLGKGANPVCGQNVQTRIGVLYALKSPVATNPSGLFERTKQTVASNFPFLSFLTPNDQHLTTNRMILIQRDNTTLSIQNESNTDLTPYHTRQVFVTGKVNSCENTLEVDDGDNVQLLP